MRRDIFAILLVFLKIQAVLFAPGAWAFSQLALTPQQITALENSPHCLAIVRFVGEVLEPKKRIQWKFEPQSSQALNRGKCPESKEFLISIENSQFFLLPNGREVRTYRADMGSPQPQAIYQIKLTQKKGSWQVMELPEALKFVHD